MEGLEITEVEFSRISVEVVLNAEYYCKEKQKATKKIKSKNKVSDYFVSVSQAISRIDCKSCCYDLTHSLSHFLEDGNIVSSINSNKKIVNEGDFIISRLRSYLQEMAVIPHKELQQIVSTEYLCFRNNSDKISTNTLMVFCLTKFVQMILNKSQYGSEHPRFHDSVLVNLPLPDCLFNLNHIIDNKLQVAQTKLQQSKTLYAEAENILLEELGLKDWQPVNNNISIKKFSDYKATDRLDAEYYQPKYDEIKNVVKSYEGGFEIVSSFFTPNKTACAFNKKAYNYIEIGDINIGDGKASYNLIPTEELPANAKIVVSKGDLLVSKVRPYRGAVAIVDFEEKDVIASGAFTVLQEKQGMKKEVLQVLLRTPYYRDWLLKWTVGSSYPVIKDKDILNLPVPKIFENNQIQICAKIQQSFALKAESKRLLEEAKTMVENEIEKGN